MTSIHLPILDQCREKYSILEGLIPVKFHRIRIEQIDNEANKPNFWANPKSVPLLKERQKLDELISSMQDFKDKIDYNIEFINEYPLEIDSAKSVLSSVLEKMSKLELELMLSDPLDDSPAILTINSGAGGLEAANWTRMLLRMYLRYANAQGFETEILDEKASEEHSAICLDSVSIRVNGKNAYGFLKSESGVHRLVRKSPFNAANARQTSFAAVQVSADIEDTIDIKINETDLEESFMRNSGAGGQNVNKRDTAVRLKHIPTGIVINSRSAREREENRRYARKMLKSKLYELELSKKTEAKDKQIAAQSDVSFGHQIRSYFLDPQQIVKDNRSEYEVRDFDKVLDGDLQPFIDAYLHYSKKS